MGAGGGEHMPHLLFLQMITVIQGEECSLALSQGLKGGRFLREWNTPRVITERSGAMLSLFSHQHVRLSVHRRHSKWGTAVWGFHASGVNNFWSMSETRWPGRRFLSVVCLACQIFSYLRLITERGANCTAGWSKRWCHWLLNCWCAKKCIQKACIQIPLWHLFFFFVLIMQQQSCTCVMYRKR